MTLSIQELVFKNQRVRITTVTLLILVSALVRANAETVQGRFRYLDFDQHLRPIRNSKIEVWTFQPRFIGIWTWAKVSDAVTDDEGYFRQNIRVGVTDAIVALRVFATNYAAVVWPNN